MRRNQGGQAEVPGVQTEQRGKPSGGFGAVNSEVPGIYAEPSGKPGGGFGELCVHRVIRRFRGSSECGLHALWLHDEPGNCRSRDEDLTSSARHSGCNPSQCTCPGHTRRPRPLPRDRKSTRLNSSHVAISYAVFCLKKKTTSDM